MFFSVVNATRLVSLASLHYPAYSSDQLLHMFLGGSFSECGELRHTS